MYKDEVYQSIGFWDKFAVAGQGGLVMGGFGLGIGLLFFIVSVVKIKKLPRTGYWMNKVKYGFGFAILTPDGKVTWSGTEYKATDKMVAEDQGLNATSPVKLAPKNAFAISLSIITTNKEKTV